MSMKERRRLSVLEQVKSDDLTLVRASKVLDLSYRQTRRVYQRFLEEGDVGLVHRLRGRPGNRSSDPMLREQAVELCRTHYADFGCTLACEYLASEHGLTVRVPTLRRWLSDAKLLRRRRRSSKKRRRRERKECFGELVQLDGSPHDWFEGRGEACVLMVMVDDATGLALAQFFESETRVASMTLFRQWSLAYGLPTELYPDQASIYRVNRKESDEEEIRTGKRPLTQFGRAMVELGVKLTCAKSPQAKGRVERMNRTFQDRLIKALRLAGINDLASANRFLSESFLPAFNAQFMVPAASDVNLHMATDAAALDGALCVKETRQVGKDHCISWNGQAMQLVLPRRKRTLAGQTVTVCEGLGGEVTVQHGEMQIAWELVAVRPKRAKEKASLAERVAGLKGPAKPSANHPWRGPAGAARPPVVPGSATASAAPQPPLHQARQAG